MQRGVVTAGDCLDCACWKCYCEAEWDATGGAPLDLSKATFYCMKGCQSSITVALVVLGVWAFLFAVFAVLKKPYIAGWMGTMTVAAGIIAIVIGTDIPSEGEEDFILSCQFPVDVIVYNAILLGIAIVTGCLAMNIFRARKKQATKAIVIPEKTDDVGVSRLRFAQMTRMEGP